MIISPSGNKREALCGHSGVDSPTEIALFVSAVARGLDSVSAADLIERCRPRSIPQELGSDVGLRSIVAISYCR